MPKGGRTAIESARLKEEIVQRSLTGDAPAETALALGVSKNYVMRVLAAWRKARGLTKFALREQRIAARLARERRSA